MVAGGARGRQDAAQGGGRRVAPGGSAVARAPRRPILAHRLPATFLHPKPSPESGREAVAAGAGGAGGGVRVQQEGGTSSYGRPLAAQGTA